MILREQGVENILYTDMERFPTYILKSKLQYSVHDVTAVVFAYVCTEAPGKNTYGI